MHAMQPRRPLLFAVLWATLAGAGCAPVFSDFQSAKLVGRDRMEVTPSASTVSFSDYESEHVQNEYGVQLGTGVSDGMDLRVGYVRAAGVNGVGFGPKISVVKDRLALALPVGFAFGEGVEISRTWTVHPTLLFTQPVTRRLEVNASAKALVPLTEDVRESLVAFNVGLGIGDLRRWAIRPEIGLLFDPGESGHYTQFGLGVTVFANKSKPARP
jgi:hypothetical protein